MVHFRWLLGSLNTLVSVIDLHSIYYQNSRHDDCSWSGLGTEWTLLIDHRVFIPPRVEPSVVVVVGPLLRSRSSPYSSLPACCLPAACSAGCLGWLEDPSLPPLAHSHQDNPKTASDATWTDLLWLLLFLFSSPPRCLGFYLSIVVIVGVPFLTRIVVWNPKSRCCCCAGLCYCEFRCLVPTWSLHRIFFFFWGLFFLPQPSQHIFSSRAHILLQNAVSGRVQKKIRQYSVGGLVWKGENNCTPWDRVATWGEVKTEDAIERKKESKPHGRGSTRRRTACGQTFLILLLLWGIWWDMWRGALLNSEEWTGWADDKTNWRIIMKMTIFCGHLYSNVYYVPPYSNSLARITVLGSL